MTVTIIGDALVDVTVAINGIQRGETIHRDITLSCSGTANVASEIARLGGKASFLGKTGNDFPGSYFRQYIDQNGVRPLISVDDTQPTGLRVSMVYANGEKSVIAKKGANDCLTTNDIDIHSNLLQQSEIAYFSGYSLLSNTDIMRHAMEKLGGRSEIWLKPKTSRIFNSPLKEIIQKYVSGLILNLNQARAVTGYNDIGQILLQLEKLTKLSVVTLTKGGCSYLENGQAIIARPEKVINGTNATGVGDAFAAGYIMGRIQKLTQLECARLGNQTAALHLTKKRERHPQLALSH